MLSFTLCGLGAGCLVLYWFTAISPKFPSAFRPFLVFGICSMLAGFGIAAVSVFYRSWLLQGRRSTLLRVAEGAIIGGGSALFALAGQKPPALIFGIVGALIILAAFWEARRAHTKSIIIGAEGILLPKGSGFKKLRWDEIEGVLLRHSILSIELTGNKLIQRNIREAGTDIQGLEQFSADLIRQHEKERLANAPW